VLVEKYLKKLTSGVYMHLNVDAVA